MLRTSSTNLIRGITRTIVNKISPSIKTLYHEIHELVDIERVTWYYITYADVATLTEFTEYVCNYLDRIVPHMLRACKQDHQSFMQYRGFISVFERVQLSIFMSKFFKHQLSCTTWKFFSRALTRYADSMNSFFQHDEQFLATMTIIHQTWEYIIDGYAGKDIRKLSQEKQARILKDTYHSTRILAPLIKYFDSDLLRRFFDKIVTEDVRRANNIDEDKLVFLAHIACVSSDEKRLTCIIDIIITHHQCHKDSFFSHTTRQSFSKLFSRFAKTIKDDENSTIVKNLLTLDDIIDGNAFMSLFSKSTKCRAAIEDESFVVERGKDIKIAMSKLATRYYTLKDKTKLRAFCYRQDSWYYLELQRSTKKQPREKSLEKLLCGSQIESCIEFIENDMYDIEIDVIDSLKKLLCRGDYQRKVFIREINIRSRSTYQHMWQPKNYLYGYMLLCCMYEHASPLHELQDIHAICESRWRVLQHLEEQKIQCRDKVPWKQRMLHGANTFLFSLILYSFSRMKNSCLLFDASLSFLFSGLNANTLGQFSAIYSRLCCYVKNDIIKLEINHACQYESLMAFLETCDNPQRQCYYTIVYYDIIDNKKIYHAGVDQMGLQLNLIQECINHILSRPYVLRDDEGKLYFDMLRIECCAKTCAREIAQFIIFLMTQNHAFYFPLKEEIIRYLCAATKEDELLEPDEGYEVLDAGTNQCLKNMQEDVKNDKMTLQTYRKYYSELVDLHRRKYINHSITFIFWIKCALIKIARGFDMFLYYESMRERMHLCKPIKVADVIGRIVLVNDEPSSVKEQVIDAIKCLDENQLTKLVILFHGSVSQDKAFGIKYVNRHCLPYWSTCSGVMTIGCDFSLAILQRAMSLVDGFHLI